MDSFEFAAGTVLGRDHARIGRNNQDAYAVWAGSEGIVAVVADGCGSRPGSEVGAQAGSHLVVHALRRRLDGLSESGPDRVLEEVRLEVLDHLDRLARAMDGRDAVERQFLFTVLGLALTPRAALVFLLGDGVVCLNGAVSVWESPGNAPPYLAHALLAEDRDRHTAPRFTVVERREAEAVQSILIGTDGLSRLAEEERSRAPGQTTGAGPLSALWADDRFFANPALATRHLNRLNRPVQRIDWQARRALRQAGRFTDDATLVVVRRRRL
jgi:hypothetical protein